jgi:hypothetical protein
VERHDITVPDEVAGGMDAAVEECRQRALDWLDAHGLEASLSVLSRAREHGVTFEVHVGHGDIDSDQRLPGVLDRWRWSARFQWWRKVLTNADGRQGRILARREDGLASVTELPRLGQHSTGKVAAAMGVGVQGCTCHLGGPFVDICPVHYQADQ